MSSKEKIVLTPNDVVLFEAAGNRQQPGYKRYRELIQESVEEYIEKTKEKKGYEVVNRITEQIQSLGGRFLEKGSDGDWREMPLLQAQRKTASIIRKLASKNKINLEDTKMDSSVAENLEDQRQAFEELQASLTKSFQDISDELDNLDISSYDFNPEPNDVLGGVSREEARLHPGNQLFLEAINERKLDYEKNVKPGGKMMIAYQVIQQVLDRKGRFVLREGYRWYVSPLEKAVTKTFQSFREALADHYGPKTEVEVAAFGEAQKDSSETGAEEEVFSMDDFKPNDVLMGSGRIQREYPGTLQYLQWMRDFKEEYDSTPKGGKSDIVYRIIGLVNEAGGRFLQRNYRERHKWYRVDPKRVFARTAQAIRELKLDEEGDDDKLKRKPKLMKFKNDRLGYKLINKQSPAGHYSLAKDSNGQSDDSGSDLSEDEDTEDDNDNGSTSGQKRLEETATKTPQTLDDAWADIPEADSDQEVFTMDDFRANDVLMGSGGDQRVYPGTFQYLQWIQDSKNEYNSAAKGRKTEIVNRVIDRVHAAGGRFLERNYTERTEWFKVPPKRVFSRTVQAFREVYGLVIRPKLKIKPVSEQKEEENDESTKNTTSGQELPSETSSDEEETGIETLTPQDVLMGAGKQVRGYAGTLRYLEWIRELKEEYDDAPIGKKTDVVQRVISLVRDSGGRFLQKDGALWAKVPRKKVFARASQAFRDMKTDTGSPNATSKVGTSQPLKLLAGIKMFKKRAPAGRYASLIQQAQKSNGSQASTENDDGQTNGDESDDDGSTDDSQNEPDGEEDVSETETEDSLPMKRRRISY